MISDLKLRLDLSDPVWQSVPPCISSALSHLSHCQDTLLNKLESTLSKPNLPEKDSSASIKRLENSLTAKFSKQVTSLSQKLDEFELKLKSLTPKDDPKPILLESRLDTFKYELKQDLISNSITPLEYELKETYKSLQFIEQQIKMQNWNIDATSKEFNCRFEVHREKLCKLENVSAEFAKEAEEIIYKVVNPVKKNIEIAEFAVKGVYNSFQKEVEEVLQEIKEKDCDREARFVEFCKGVEIFKAEADKAVKNVNTLSTMNMQRLDLSISQMKNDLENAKSELLMSQREYYEETRAELLKSYKKDIRKIDEKLRWLPTNMQDISDMTPIEARLFTIETRIKTEENNRITQVNKLIDGIIYLDLSRVVFSSKKKGVKDHRKYSFSVNRCTTPTPVGVKVCKSPGGMRLNRSNSNKRLLKRIVHQEKSMSLLKDKCVP